jgi:hypothetical protein
MKLMMFSIAVFIAIVSFQRPSLAQETTPSEKSVDADQAGERQEGEETDGVVVSEVRQTLRALESNVLAERDAAEKKLIEFGPSVVPLLPQVTTRTSGEMKVRLQRIRQALQASTIETYFKASNVTLKGTMEVADAIKAIQEQTENVIELQSQDGSASMMVELDCQDEPFWSVVAKIMSQAKLRINAFGTTTGNLVLSPGGSDQMRDPSTSGPFRVDVVSVQTRRLFNTQYEGQLDLSLQLVWEPRLKPVFMQVPMASVAVSVDGEKELAALNEQAVPEVPLNLGSCSTQIDLQIERPDRSVQKIDSLKGEVVIAVPSDRHQYVFEKFGDGARKTEKFGDVAVTLEGSRHNGAVYEMRVMVEFGDSQGALESFRGWILSNEAYLLDANDKRLENVGLNTYAVRANGVGIAYLFQINSNPDDYKLIYESPAAISKQTVTYELKDIELP